MAADFAQLKDRIPRVLTAREDFLEQQRLMLAEVRKGLKWLID